MEKCRLKSELRKVEVMELSIARWDVVAFSYVCEIGRLVMDDDVFR